MAIWLATSEPDHIKQFVIFSEILSEALSCDLLGLKFGLSGGYERITEHGANPIS